MSVLLRDPLLTALRAIIWFAIGVLCLAASGLIVGSPFVVIFQSDIAAELLKEGKTAPPGFFAALVFLLLGIAAIVIMGIYFFWNLLAITDTVRDGDPFIPENARRLTRMGWFVVAIYVGGFIVAIPGAWVASIAADAGDESASCSASSLRRVASGEEAEEEEAVVVVAAAVAAAPAASRP